MTQTWVSLARSIWGIGVKTGSMCYYKGEGRALHLPQCPSKLEKAQQGDSEKPEKEKKTATIVMKNIGFQVQRLFTEKKERRRRQFTKLLLWRYTDFLQGQNL